MRRIVESKMPLREMYVFFVLLAHANHRTFGNARPSVRPYPADGGQR